VIDLQTIRQLAAPHPVVVVDHNGEPMDRLGLPDELPVPGLLVSPVYEAVKQVDAGRLIADLDRDSLWAVTGFVLDITVLDALGEGTYSAADLIGAVTSAGFDWKPTIL
jgi:hypothetical protein